MKFILFVEGETEFGVLPEFLKRWLDVKLNGPVGIKPVNLRGWSELVREAPTKARLHLNDPKRGQDIIAVIALLDLYGPRLPYPSHKMAVAERYDWAKKHLETKVGHPKFRQFFAVHETEAWLLSNPNLFPTEIRNALPGKIREPETVNFDEPPARLLDNLYQHKLKRHYKKVVDGQELFGKLDPAMAYHKCPFLKDMLDEMLKLAKDAGL
ncbi:MAG: DUF4276 family protein [Abitibacteriaceae bacterium]|nr:DUF4276 family protein [Abditibacteriaceae bacterium]MBV9866733.1 DUF4276 family protein [Abditibacteriaceae bacterium]